jgi:hypothetical protein
MEFFSPGYSLNGNGKFRLMGKTKGQSILRQIALNERIADM